MRITTKRVPQDTEAGVPLGYMSFAALDGSWLAIYYINRKSTTFVAESRDCDVARP